MIPTSGGLIIGVKNFPPMPLNEDIVKVKIKEPFDQNPFPYADTFTRLIKDKKNIVYIVAIFLAKH